jgi:alpha-mannosidase
MRSFGYSLLFNVVCLAAEHGVQFGQIEPTVLIVRGQPLTQIAMADFWNPSDQPLQCRVVAKAAQGQAETSVFTLAPGATRHRVLVPDIAEPGKVGFGAIAEDGKTVIASTVKDWTPARKWKVYIVKSSHEDLGYEDFIQKKQQENAIWVDIARRLSNPSLPMGGGQYHHTLESMLLMRNYMDERSEPAFRDMADKQIQTGQIALMGAPSGVHSHWMDYEEIARMTYPGRREAKDRFGLDLKTFMIVDNPSLSWSGAQAVAAAGFRYVARWGQSWRSGGNNDYAHTKVPAIFWWQAPDGEHRVLYAWRSHYGQAFWYGQQGGGYGETIDLGSENVDRELKKIESGEALGPYPYDAVVSPNYVDHAIPFVDERMLPAWSRAYAYPEIHLDSPTKFFEYIESKYGTVLPILTGDLNNFSADYATIDPESQGWKREASRKLPVAEGLAAIGSTLSRTFQPVTARAAAIWTQMFDYDEHSWPTQPKAVDFHLFNANWVKKQGAQRALRDTNQLFDSAWEAVAAAIPTAGQSLVVFNSLAHERDGPVEVDGLFTALKDLATGETVAGQKTEGGKTLFFARRVPAFGYKVYRRAADTAPAAGDLSATQSTLANQFYEIRFDPKTGSIVSLKDRKSGREFVDGAAKYQFNQMVYVHKNSKDAKEGFEHIAGPAARTHSSAGPLKATFESWTNDEPTGAALHQTVAIYRDDNRIDITNEMSHARVMFSNKLEDRYKENIFFAFPLAIPGGQGRAEYPGGVVRPYDDQLRWGTHDYLSANRWVDVSNGQFGFTIAPINEQIFHFGEIRYNEFSVNYKPSKPYLFGYAWSNRMAGLLTLEPEDCNATVRYTMAPHEGDWGAGNASRLGWSVASPLISREVKPNTAGTLDPKQQSFITIDQSNVQLTVLKASEQPGKGWVIRLVETEGKPVDASVQFHLFRPDQAFLCDLVEEDKAPLAISNGELKVHVPPFGFSTIRVSEGTAPFGKSTLSAVALSGETVRVSWPGSAAANMFYNVYRSQDPNDPPTAYTLIARTAQPSLLDGGLSPGGVYYYHVGAVSKTNLQGPVSERVSVRTLEKNLEPPAPVEDLSVIRVAPERLIVTWLKSKDADTSRFLVYRGKSASFPLAGSTPIATVQPGGYFLETFTDTGLHGGQTYYYKVVAEDWAGHRQSKSPVAWATTPRETH